MKIKMIIPADWALRFRAATHEDKKSSRKRRNSKESKRRLRKELSGE
jgi:hypothetical protein